MTIRCAKYFGIAVLAVLVVAAPAAAKGKPPKGDPPAALVAEAGGGEGLAPSIPAEAQAERAVLFGAAAAGLTPDAQSQARLAARWFGCTDAYAYRGYSNFGVTLFRYYQQVSWCSNGFSIYSWSRFRWPSDIGPGWRFDGHIGSNLYGSTTQKTAWTQGAFAGCYFGVCAHKYPWINMDVRVDGSYSWWTGD